MWGSHLAFRFCEKENPMTKFTLLGAAVVLSSALAGPAMAQHIVAHPPYYAQGPPCLNREPGTPYTKEEDSLASCSIHASADFLSGSPQRYFAADHVHCPCQQTTARERVHCTPGGRQNSQ